MSTSGTPCHECPVTSHRVHPHHSVQTKGGIHQSYDEGPLRLDRYTEGPIKAWTATRAVVRDRGAFVVHGVDPEHSPIEGIDDHQGSCGFNGNPLRCNDARATANGPGSP